MDDTGVLTLFFPASLSGNDASFIANFASSSRVRTYVEFSEFWEWNQTESMLNRKEKSISGQKYFLCKGVGTQSTKSSKE